MDGQIQKAKRLGTTDFRKMTEQQQQEVKRKIELELTTLLSTGASMAHIEPHLCDSLGFSMNLIKLVTESKEWQKKYQWARRKA